MALRTPNLEPEVNKIESFQDIIKKNIKDFFPKDKSGSLDKDWLIEIAKGIKSYMAESLSAATTEQNSPRSGPSTSPSFFDISSISSRERDKGSNCLVFI